jgi:hypothetical protein
MSSPLPATLLIAAALATAGCSSTPRLPGVTSTVTTTVQAGAAQHAKLDQRGIEQDTRQAALDDRESKLAADEQLALRNIIPGDGTYLIGQEMEPGTWRSAGKKGCYWARKAGTSGQFSDLVANENTDGPAVVTIDPSDVAFETARCGEWKKIG